MNIWVEYFKYNDNRQNNHAQFKEQAKWIPPDPDDIIKRFCQNRKEAIEVSKSLFDQGYHTSIKTDGEYY